MNRESAYVSSEIHKILSKNKVFSDCAKNCVLLILFLFIGIKYTYLLQELRKLVRKVHSAQEMKTTTNEEEEKKIEILEIKAKKALTRFLRSLSKNIANEHS